LYFPNKISQQTFVRIARTGKHSLKPALGRLNLVTLRIGAIIGVGIFMLTGNAASNYAEPAVVISFIYTKNVRRKYPEETNNETTEH